MGGRKEGSGLVKVRREGGKRDGIGKKDGRWGSEAGRTGRMMGHSSWVEPWIG